MDIYCKRCGEPWDMDTLHDEIDYRCDGRTPEGDAFGDDLDGVASDLMDAEAMGLFR